MSTIRVMEWATTDSRTIGDAEPVVIRKRRTTVLSEHYAALTVRGLLDFADAVRKADLALGVLVLPVTDEGRMTGLRAEDEVTV